MLPVPDFNFMVCGMATFAATVGYVCSKRLVRRNSTFGSGSTNDSFTASSTSEDVPMLVDQAVPPVLSDSEKISTMKLSEAPRDLKIEEEEMPSASVNEAACPVEIKQELVSVQIPTQPIVPEPMLNLPPVVVLPFAPPVSGSAPDRRQSLKRKKMHDHDENNNDLEYPYNLTAIYPNKRRTPPREERSSRDEQASQEQMNPALDSSPVPPQSTDVKHPDRGADNAAECTSVNTVGVSVPPTQSDFYEAPTTPSVQPDPKPQLPLPRSSPKSILASSMNNVNVKPSTTISTFSASTTSNFVSSSRPNTNSTPKKKPFTAFSSYASPNTSSPFSPFSVNNTTSGGNPSPFLTTTSNNRPIWSSSIRKRHVFSDHDDASTDHGDQESALAFGAGENGKEMNGHAIGSRSASKTEGTSTGYNHITGEEEETIECELKGVKLFVKRGTKEYSTGMLGHVKLLSSKNHDVERLLFRREPLWKVSMNARLQPTVRCSFDSEESILRVVMPEFLESSGSGSPASEKTESRSLNGAASPEVVVYAMKPGRFCSKQEFGDFATSVMKRTNVKDQA
ncbi:hypothetical protein VKT23_017041 [Stygiomarasmius scandens]|uniref:RanBD1 domain-containing protein n=1 Tax=Marasmiellus scandens TaxID=2682957 RepID=A0ABR1IT42_9AGAR